MKNGNIDALNLIKEADIMIGDNLRLVSKKRIKNAIRSRSFARDPIFWNNGALVWGVRVSVESSEDHGYELKNVKKLFALPKYLKFVDDILYFYAEYDRLEQGQIDDAVSFLKSAPRDSKGGVLYRQDNLSFFIDIIGMVCPFLVRYGVENSDAEAIRLAMSQFNALFENGIDGQTGLPYHGYNSVSGEKQGIIGWGRGLGWLLIGLLESLKYLDEGSDEYIQVRSYSKNILSKVLEHVRPSGGVSWQLQAVDGPFDSSATAMIAYAAALYGEITSDKSFEEFVKGSVDPLLACISVSGAVSGSSAECRGFSMYPQYYENNAWGQGFTMLFFAHLNKDKAKNGS